MKSLLNTIINYISLSVLLFIVIGIITYCFDVILLNLVTSDVSPCTKRIASFYFHLIEAGLCLMSLLFLEVRLFHLVLLFSAQVY